MSVFPGEHLFLLQGSLLASVQAGKASEGRVAAGFHVIYRIRLRVNAAGKRH